MRARLQLLVEHGEDHSDLVAANVHAGQEVGEVLIGVEPGEQLRQGQVAALVLARPASFPLTRRTTEVK